MSRDAVSSGRIAIVIGMLAVGLASTPMALGQNATAKKFSIHEKLAMEIETKEFTDPRTLKDFIQNIYEKAAEKGVELAILIDVASFKMEDESAPNPYDAQVQLPAIPRTVTVAEALRMAIRQLPINNGHMGAMLLRNGKIEIVSTTAATPQVLLQETLPPRSFDKVPFAEVMRQISEMTGVTILLDPRLQEKAQTGISAEFRGDVRVEAALRMLSDMVELRMVLMEGGVYVTTPSNAEALEKQVRKRKLEREKEEAK
jgi:hypothetical protein